MVMNMTMVLVLGMGLWTMTTTSSLIRTLTISRHQVSRRYGLRSIILENTL